MTQNKESTEFGTRAVTPEEKTGLVRGVFDSVADRYDVMNDLMSGGVHRIWKDKFVRMIRPRAGYSYLDVAGGTGDIAFRLYKKTQEASRAESPYGKEKKQAPITVFDLNRNMLEVGRDRAIDRGYIKNLDWVTGNAETLPFDDESFDVYTIAFGLRNVTHIDDALKEAHRVLKPGGRFFCLEFSQVQNPLLSRAYDAFSYNVIPRMGKIVANDEESYQYLVESIRKFPPQDALKTRMESAGFTHCSYTNLTGGIAAIHTGFKD